MADLSVVRLSELSPVPRAEVSRLFVQAYKDDLQPLCKDLGRWARALEPAFVPERFLVAVRDSKVVGMAAFSVGSHRALRLDARAMRRHLGLLRGSLLYLAMSRSFHKKLKYPPTTAYIEAVATAAEARGQGVATTIFEHLHALPYQELILDVVDTNTGAKRLYERLGYVEFERHKAPPGTKYKWQIYMKRPATPA